LDEFSCSIVDKNLDRSFFRFVTIHTFDRQTDGRKDGHTAFLSLDRVYIPAAR